MTMLIGCALLFTAAPPGLAQRGPYDRPDPKPEDRIIASFSAEVESRAMRRVRFRWTIEASQANDDITCTIDADDDAILEESVENCEDTKDVVFTYDEPGTYRAVLLARSRSGGADRAVTTVTVD